MLTVIASLLGGLNARASADSVPKQVLAYYYGWYGNPSFGGNWRHWKGVDAAHKRIGDATDFPALGAYDSHDPAIVQQQAKTAQAAGITGFVASWWGRNGYEDRGMPLLLSTAGNLGMVVSVLYERVGGKSPSARVASTVADFDYLLSRYGRDPAWLHVHGRPVIFVYGRALHSLSPTGWQQAIGQVQRDNPGGVLFFANLLGHNLLGREYRSIFDGMAVYGVTGNLKHKTPGEIRAWAHRAYPGWIAEAGPGKISGVTVMPGYDDRHLGRPPPRPVTQRWGDQTYRALWQEAIAAAPDYILITSWNEFQEGTEIEPSIQYGSRFVRDTAVFAREFLSRRK